MEITKSELRQILKTNTHNKTNLFKGVWVSQGYRFSDMFLKLKRIYYYTNDYFTLEFQGLLSSTPSIQIRFDEIKKIIKTQHSIVIKLTHDLTIMIYDNYAGIK